jgi:hypothetical protein
MTDVWPFQVVSSTTVELVLLGVTAMWWFCWNLDAAWAQIRDVCVIWHRWVAARRVRRAERQLDYRAGHGTAAIYRETRGG